MAKRELETNALDSMVEPAKSSSAKNWSRQRIFVRPGRFSGLPGKRNLVPCRCVGRSGSGTPSKEDRHRPCVCSYR